MATENFKQALDNLDIADRSFKSNDTETGIYTLLRGVSLGVAHIEDLLTQQNRILVHLLETNDTKPSS